MDTTLKIKVGDTFTNTIEYDIYLRYIPIDGCYLPKDWYENFFMDTTLTILFIRNKNGTFQKSFQNPQDIIEIVVKNLGKDVITLPPLDVYEMLKRKEVWPS